MIDWVRFVWYNGLMNKLDYVALKLGAKNKRAKRLDWLDTKLRDYALEREEVLLEIARDSTTIEQLGVLKTQETGLEESIEALTHKVYESNGEDAKTALAELAGTQKALEELEEKIRGVYYDR